MMRSHCIAALVFILSIGMVAHGVMAQSIIIDGYTDCQRATNGRAYCKKIGTSSGQVFAVSDDFFNRFEIARTGNIPKIAPVDQSSVVQQQLNSTTNNFTVINLMKDVSELKGQQALISKLIEEQKADTSKSTDPNMSAQTVAALGSRAKELQENIDRKQTEASRYSTSLKPDDKSLYNTARKESEIFPKIPYYIAGTNETGEFWVEPVVKEDGTLIFNFRFVDVSSTAVDKVRSSIEMTPDELEVVRASMTKIFNNSRIARENKIRRTLSKRVACFPVANCPPEGEKVDKRSSTEILFLVSEDGSTGSRIQRNKGRYEEGYNLSVNSALLLAAYLKHISLEGKNEFEAGSRTTDEVKKLFE